MRVLLLFCSCICICVHVSAYIFDSDSCFFFLSLMCTFWETQSFVLWSLVHGLSVVGWGCTCLCVHMQRPEKRPEKDVFVYCLHVYTCRSLRRMSSSITVFMCTHAEAREGCLPLLQFACLCMQRPEQDIFLYCSLL